jgi:hypothetical protein
VPILNRWSLVPFPEQAERALGKSSLLSTCRNADKGVAVWVSLVSYCRGQTTCQTLCVCSVKLFYSNIPDRILPGLDLLGSGIGVVRAVESARPLLGQLRSPYGQSTAAYRPNGNRRSKGIHLTSLASQAIALHSSNCSSRNYVCIGKGKLPGRSIAAVCPTAVIFLSSSRISDQSVLQMLSCALAGRLEYIG